MPADHDLERLQKVLAHAGIASRRKCEEYIAAGRVTVNGQVVTEMGAKVAPHSDRITFDGRLVSADARSRCYYVLYKPTGYLSTVRDPHGRPTARGLVPTKERLYPVGRLDLDSEGLMLFTNDGQLAHRLMHPRYEHEKEYRVLVKGRVARATLERLRAGVVIGDDQARVRAKVRRLPASWHWRGQRAPRQCNWLSVVLHQGRKRQIRYMMGTVGHPVLRLVRVRIDRLSVDDLQPGQGRWLWDKEVAALRHAAGLS